MRVLSIGETLRLLRGMPALPVVLSVDVVPVVGGVVVVVLELFIELESVVVLELGVVVVVVLELGVVVLVELPVVLLSVCWLCVGVGAAAPVPSCVDDESVLVVVVDVDGVVVVDDDGVVVDDDEPDIEDESVVVEDEGVVVVEDDGVVVVDGDDVTSPVDVECEPSFDTRM